MVARFDFEDAFFEQKIELLKQRKSQRFASEYEVHPNQISKWKKRALELLPTLFEKRGDQKGQRPDPAMDDLYKQIGQLQVENGWLKKKSEILTG